MAMRANHLMRMHPECALALEVLKANGGELTVCEWFALHPSLSSCTQGERTHLVSQLAGAGYIRKAGRKRIPRSPDKGRTGSDWRMAWRVV